MEDVSLRRGCFLDTQAETVADRDCLPGRERHTCDSQRGLFRNGGNFEQRTHVQSGELIQRHAALRDHNRGIETERQRVALVATWGMSQEESIGIVYRQQDRHADYLGVPPQA